MKTYYLAKALFKMRLSSFRDCEIDRTARVNAGSVFTKVKMGRYSYAGAAAYVTDAHIGNFCSIAGGCQIGGGIHPMDTVSTSPVFLQGRNFLRKNFAAIPYAPSETVEIGSDVWIGEGVYIKAGIKIGSGAVIGAHAVVTHDVAPYAVAAGVPARVLRKRFDDGTIRRLLELQWWNWPEEKLEKYGALFTDPEKLLGALEQERPGGRI